MTDTPNELVERLRFGLRDWDRKSRIHFPRVNALNLSDAADTIEAQQAEMARLREALEPFAAYADPSKAIPDGFTITPGSAFAKRQLKMGDCRRARAALEGES